MKRKWLSLDERINLALHHMTTSADRRPIVKGTVLEGLPFLLTYMGERLVGLHSSPGLSEIPGRYLAALSLCIDANPPFSADGFSAQSVAEHLANYLCRHVNQRGEIEITHNEIDAIKSPKHLFVEPVIQLNEKPSAVERRWWSSALGILSHIQASMALEGLIYWYLRTSDRDAKRAISKMISGRAMKLENRDAVWPPIMTPLAIYYEATGDEAARHYLDDVADFFFKDLYYKEFPDGKHCHGYGVGHLHMRMGTLAAVARYAKLYDHADLLAMTDELLTVNSSYGTEFGWMPERHVFTYKSVGYSGTIYQPWVALEGVKIDFAHYTRPRCGWDTCEICVPADAIDAAIFLAKCGYEKYWDIAERWLNHLFEAQIRDDSFIIERKRGDIEEKICATFENVRNHIPGAWSSFSSPTWMVPRMCYPKMRRDGREGLREGKYYSVGVACCHGWGARALGLVWQNIINEDGNKIEVNFPFNKKTASVEVESKLPFSGKISIKALKSVELFVRIPDWVEHSSVEVLVNGRQRAKAEFKGPFSDYVKVGRLKPKDEAEVRYPLRREKKRYYIAYHPFVYEADWLGNYVMGMKAIPVKEPEGEETFEGFGKLYEY